MGTKYLIRRVKNSHTKRKRIKMRVCCLISSLAAFFTTSLACDDDQLANVNTVFTGKLLRKLKDRTKHNNFYGTVFTASCPRPTYRIAHYRAFDEFSGSEKKFSTNEKGEKIMKHKLEQFHLHSTSSNSACNEKAIDCHKLSFDTIVSSGKKRIANIEFDCVPVQNHQTLTIEWVRKYVLISQKVKSVTQGCDIKKWGLEYSGHEFGGKFDNVHIHNSGCNKFLNCDNLDMKTKTFGCDVNSSHHEHDHDGHHNHDHTGHSHNH